MSFISWMRSGISTRARRRLGQPRPTPRRFRPTLEALEDRAVPSTLTVTSAADSGPGSLRADIAAAKSGDTIIFDPSLDGQTIALTSGVLDVDKSVTIQGPGAGLLTISGDNLSQVFEVKANQTVVLSGMTITGGQATFSGGAIEDYGNLTLNSCTVTGNTSARDGGAIDVRPYSGTVHGAEVSLTIDNCIISNNSAPFGGAITAYPTATTTISNSMVFGNSSNFGGVIDNDGSLTISNSMLLGNSATQEGGAIFSIYSTATVTVSGSIFSGNSAGDYGGAIFYSAAGLTVSGCTITGNSAGIDGGGIDFAGGRATVSDTFFCGNTPDNTVGSFTDGGGNTFC
jgi:hypothetical protein